MILKTNMGQSAVIRLFGLELAALIFQLARLYFGGSVTTTPENIATTLVFMALTVLLFFMPLPSHVIFFITALCINSVAVSSLLVNGFNADMPPWLVGIVTPLFIYSYQQFYILIKKGLFVVLGFNLVALSSLLYLIPDTYEFTMIIINIFMLGVIVFFVGEWLNQKQTCDFYQVKLNTKEQLINKYKAENTTLKNTLTLIFKLFSKSVVSYLEGETVTKVKFVDNLPQMWVDNGYGEVFIRVLPLLSYPDIKQTQIGDRVKAWGIIGGKRLTETQRITIFWALYVDITTKLRD